MSELAAIRSAAKESKTGDSSTQSQFGKTFFMYRPLLHAACLFLMLTGVRVSLAEPGAAASPREIKTYAFELVNVGEFERARTMFERLAGMTGDPLARGAWFHWGNLLELHAMMDAGSLSAARGVLLEAHEAHNRAMAALQAEPPGGQMHNVRNLIRSHIDVIEDHLRAIDSIESGEVALIDATERIDDMNAPAAAAALLGPEPELDKPGADQYYLLSSVYRLTYVDHLYLRLRNMWQAAARPDSDLLSEGARARELDRLHQATEESARLLDTALGNFGNSPHWLDFLSFSADNHRYQGMLNLMRADLARDGREADSFAGDDPGAAFEARALDHFEQLIAQTRRIVAFTDEALRDRSVLSRRQAGVYSQARLESYGVIARDSLAGAANLSERVSLSVAPSAPIPASDE